MSYLSRRMREDGWPKWRQLMIGDLAERLGYTLNPWQKAMANAMFASRVRGTIRMKGYWY